MFRKSGLLGLVIILVTLTFGLFGQVVWTEPAFPTQIDYVKVYFDATKGNGALAGFTGDVYAHTGVITSQSSSPSDWKHVQGTWGTLDPNVLMTREGDDLYSISYNIETFYSLNPGELVEKLSFVFRNGDGSTVGRESDGSDIFYDVYPPGQGILINLISPSDNNTILYEGEIVNIDLQINQSTHITIEDNGDVIYDDIADAVLLPITANGLGQHVLKFTISYDLDTQRIESKYFVLEQNEMTFPKPAGIQPGVNYLANDEIGFMLVAPLKKNVFLLCPENSYSVDIDFKMNKSTDGSSFWLSLPKSIFENGKSTYQYLVDGQIKVADPFSTVILDPSNDDEVSEDILLDLSPYPEEMTTGIVTAFDTEKSEYPWEVDDFVKPDKSDLVIYELLLRDFLEDHSYQSLIDTLDYLEKLGVTAIELMPINEFEGNNSWGYNPSFHMAVDKYYGSRNQLKQFIDESHKRGIAVILDVVFNHAFSQSPLCQMWWNSADFKPSADNPYLNEDPKHPFNVGYDFNHASPYTRQWVVLILLHWSTEYHFDGYRFDLSKGLTQTNSGNNVGLMSQYDESRINTLKGYADHIWSIENDAYVILEHFAENEEERELSDYGMMLWGNTTFQFAEAAMGYSSFLNGASYKSKGWDDPHLIAYMESHDEERMGFKINEYGNSTSSYNTKETWTFADRMVATSLIYLSIPGPKMLWQFGEVGYDYSINRCEDGSINDNCRLSPKPVRWDFTEMEARASIYNRMAAILELRNTQDVFKTSSFNLINNAYTKAVVLDGYDLDVISVANFNVVPESINVTFTNIGTWYEYFTGATIEVATLNQNIDLGPGEYKMYLTEPLSPSQENTNLVIDLTTEEINVFPNPVLSGANIFIQIKDSSTMQSIEIIDVKGGMIKIMAGNEAMSLGISTEGLEAGAYIIKLKSEKGIHLKKVIIL